MKKFIEKTGNKIDGTTKEPGSAGPGTVLNIEGTKYIVLEEQGNNQVLVITVDSIGGRRFQAYTSNGLRQDGQYINTYEGSEIDNYLENDWYKGLSAKMQSAIQSTNIKQISCPTYDDPDLKQETGYNGQIYNTISRHVFLPSVSEINKVIDLRRRDKVKEFLNGTNIWTRDSYRGYACFAEYLDADDGCLDFYNVGYTYSIRPAFVVDLSDVNYSVVKLNAYNKLDRLTDEFESVSPEAVIDVGGTKYIIVPEKRGDNQAFAFKLEIGNNFDGTTREPGTAVPGTVLNIEGTKYIVLEEQGDNQVLVMTVDSIGGRRFHADSSNDLRSDGQYINTYENSEIDSYLENNWYKGLSAKMQNAIQTTDIKQASYADYNGPDSKQETGYKGKVYNTISRHVFLPSVSEIGKVVDLRSPDKVKEFLSGTSIWTRDSYQDSGYYAEFLYTSLGNLFYDYVGYVYDVRPAFVINLSQVNYTVMGTLNLK